MTKDLPDDELRCLQAGPECSGSVEYRMALTDSDESFPRCGHHWTKRLELEEGLNQRYPRTPPADWSHYDAGEYWDENDY